MRARTDSVSLAEARFLALHAGGVLTEPAEHAEHNIRNFFERHGVLQIDSVNVFERSHYLPPRARFGNYDKAALDELTLSATPKYIEYWAHMAAFIPIEDRPLFQWRMNGMHTGPKSQEFAHEHKKLLNDIKKRLADEGPLRSSDFENARNLGSWWGWSDVKQALEFLFDRGEVSAAGRLNFQRRYTLSSQLIPAEIMARSVSKDDAHDQLVRKAVRGLGIGTLADINDYYRLKIVDTRAAIVRLLTTGELVELALEGESKPVYSTPEALTALSGFSKHSYGPEARFLSPFDPLVWYRPRTELLFDFHYRIEIYTPEAKRIFGYYSLPILLGDQLIGRADLKADRKAKTLLVQSSWLEDARQAEQFSEAVAQELHHIAQWQNLESVIVKPTGNFAAALEQRLNSA